MVTVAGDASCVPSGSMENPCKKKRGDPPSVVGGTSVETLMVVSDDRAPAGIVMERPLSGEFGSSTVIVPPLSAEIRTDTSGMSANTETVKLWLVWPRESCATIVIDRSP